MLNLEPIKEIMCGNIGKILLVGALLIIGNLLFKKLEKRLKSKTLSFRHSGERRNPVFSRSYETPGPRFSTG
ncbi:MAG: hypothetical protein COS92_02100 [Desulfobacterales bacterium CG07_land_8_20_14_0_80_52_14]|nr:MAG: hypothetical protein COX20_13695 [Desulfobacterales bacterium CG23_combo_of_CG06-09_8_20_14_all_52_9]PIU50285.1 MAG: hypothetical protein COS92_02100 [Desulfobacterales bacterium CG07_land_8_20_14_0_80_52_14]